MIKIVIRNWFRGTAANKYVVVYRTTLATIDIVLKRHYEYYVDKFGVINYVDFN